MKNGRLVNFAYVVFCLLYSVSINAATYNAELIDDAYIDSSGNVSARYTVSRQSELTGSKTYQSKTIKYPATRSKELILSGKDLAKNSAVNALVIGSVLAAGWAIDELTGQVTGAPVPYPQGGSMDYEPGTYFATVWNAGGTPVQFFPTGGEACTASDAYAHLNNSSVQMEGSICRAYYGAQLLNSKVPTRISCSAGGNASNVPWCVDPSQHPTQPGTSVADADFMDLMGDTLTTDQLIDLLTTEGGLPTSTPELLQDLADLAANDSEELSDVADVPDPEESPSTYCARPENSGSPDCQMQAEAEDVEFCKDPINSDHPNCKKLDEKQPDINPLPTTTLNIDLASFDSGLGNGTCPTADTETFQGQTVGYDYSQACDAIETYIYPVTIAGSWLIACGIILGVRI